MSLDSIPPVIALPLAVAGTIAYLVLEVHAGRSHR